MENHDFAIAQQAVQLEEHSRRIQRLEDMEAEQMKTLAHITTMLTEIRTEMKVRNEIGSQIRTMVWAIIMLVLSQLANVVMEVLKK